VNSGRRAILLITCPDARGIVAAVTQYVSQHHGNILDLDQHVDEEERVFFMRVEWELDGFGVDDADIPASFQPVADRFRMTRELYFSDAAPRLALFVSRQFHCLYDILARWRSGEWRVEIPLIVSNHEEVLPVARQFGVEARVFPIEPDTKTDQEEREAALLAEHRIDTVVLARYMQIVTPRLIGAFPNRIINIHHSFLPAFPGSRPYHSAYARGVKIIGATSHYVTEDLDAGPIIAQDVIPVSHKDSVADLVRKGKDLEKIVLARAIWHHLQRRILVYDNKTVIFE
jgi:formyltetrahydrofolate deformylase